jgi:hemolysin activation/secretion protein
VYEEAKNNHVKTYLHRARISGACAALGWVLASSQAPAAVLFFVGQISEMGQEIQRLQRQIQDVPTAPPERKKPPAAVVETERASGSVELSEEPTDIRQAIGKRIDADTEQLERDAEAILQEADAGRNGMVDAVEADIAESVGAEVEQAAVEAAEAGAEAADAPGTESAEESRPVESTAGPADEGGEQAVVEEAPAPEDTREAAPAASTSARIGAAAEEAGAEAPAAETAAEGEAVAAPLTAVPETAESLKAAAESAAETTAEVQAADLDAPVGAEPDGSADAAAPESVAPEPTSEDEKEPAEVREEAPAQRRPTRRSARRGQGTSFEIQTVTIEGDSQLFDELGLTEQLKQETVGKTLSSREIRDVARTYNKALVDAGYYLSRISTPPSALGRLREGELALEVDEGRVGKTSFFSPTQGEEKVAYRGRWYSERQLRQRLSGLDEGAPFRYDDFYKSVFAVNSHPDLTMDTDLKVRRERTEEGRQQRYVDMDFTVKDRIPIHGVFELQNSGTEATEAWRMALTLQHLNLTKHDDVLTLTIPVSVDLNTIRSVAGSYYYPHHIGRGGAFTVYGGYSELDTTDLVPDIDLSGTGYFVGLLGSYDLLATDYHSLKLSAGWAYQFIEDTLLLGGEISAPREVKVAPFSFIASYSSIRPDRLGGRNFATSQFSFNIGGFAGTSEDDEVSLLRETAEANYWIERLQFARIQPVGWGGSDPDQQASQWIVFLKLDGQLSSGALIPAEQKAVGGLDNVRGYTEREILGDQGVSGTMELRSPIWSFDYTNRIRKRDDGGSADRLQLVAFVDAAYMTLEDALEGVDDTTTLLSIGAGLRTAITKYTQLKFDWGFPLEETELSDTGGRGHVSFEIQI